MRFSVCVKALVLESNWVVVVQLEWLRPCSVKTAVACFLSRRQSPPSGVKVASTEPRDAKFPRPEHQLHGVVRWSLGLYRHQLLPQFTNTAVVSVDLPILLLLDLLLLRFEHRRVSPRQDRANILALVEKGLLAADDTVFLVEFSDVC